MKIIYTIKTWAVGIALMLVSELLLAQGAIAIDLQNVTVDGTSLCFDVYLSQGAGYTPAQNGGEWTAITLTFDLDVLTPTMGLSLDRTNAMFSNGNNAIIDATNLAAPNPPPGSVMGYETKGRLSITNGTQKALPVSPTHAFSVCYPILGGPVTTDGTSDVQIRTSTLATGSFWTNGTLFSQPLSPQDAMEPLPIELLLFELRGAGCEMELYWETARERNLAYYEIELSKDGRVFSGVWQHKPASPNSTSRRAYRYAIPREYQDQYLRMKAVDMDGVYEYSEVIYVKSRCEDKEYELHLYPNPNYTTELVVELKSAQAVEKVELQLLDAYGKLLRKQKVEQVEVGINKISMETADLPTGTYFIKILGIDQLQSPLKFIRSNF